MFSNNVCVAKKLTQPPSGYQWDVLHPYPIRKKNRNLAEIKYTFENVVIQGITFPLSYYNTVKSFYTAVVRILRCIVTLVVTFYS